MPYKDSGKQKEYDKERMRRTRQGRTEQVEQGRVEQTRIEFIKQELGADLVRDIEQLGGAESRYERAYRYYLWKQGKVSNIVPVIVDDRERLEKVYRSLKDANQDMNVYYGNPYNGISFDLIGEMLEVTR